MTRDYGRQCKPYGKVVMCERTGTGKGRAIEGRKEEREGMRIHEMRKRITRQENITRTDATRTMY